MRKQIVTVLILAILSIFLISCGKSKTEYDIEEFGAIYEKTEEMFEKESEYLTKDELNGDKGNELYKKCSQKTGLPFNKEITIRGKKEAAPISGFYVKSSDGKYSVYCHVDSNEINKSLFVDNGESIVVKGVFAKKDVGYCFISDPVIISPENINTDYKSNVSDTLDNIDDIVCSVVIGEIVDVQSLDEFNDLMDIMVGTVTYESSDVYYENVITVSDGNDENGLISFTCNDDNLKIGDKISISGYVNSLAELLLADGTTETWWGFIDNVSNVYVFE
ncbi:Uncharacterised protein [[Eubacterium] contortum]|uniref:tRNA_anti-like n=1 Tax=Faecalicatena contorta TaxID=39482 RepID=A0A174MWK5_9FIRM|nr:hypothetical protein [Faecalicatena contorta]CUP40713.1 Uncharacterised protein [[Eubacterium] contortum] [Faecalicatena contorta]